MLSTVNVASFSFVSRETLRNINAELPLKCLVNVQSHYYGSSITESANKTSDKIIGLPFSQHQVKT